MLRSIMLAIALFLTSLTTTFAQGREVTFDSTVPVGALVVSFGDKQLYHVVRQGIAVSFPIAVPKNAAGHDARWYGTVRVIKKAVNPSWTATAEMIKRDANITRHVPGGHARNPLGVRALYLGDMHSGKDTGYRIHGTDAPSSIGLPVSSGCIRMHNVDVVALYERVTVGAPVVVTYKSYK
jgi:lipoprotein-anchoring transpeptidase ErfK/SrfK